MCGGTLHESRIEAVALGLSPRVRGNRSPVSYIQRNQGSIPACAGEPTSGAPLPPVLKVYPRVCGGTSVTRRGIFFSNGLSPRVRGNLPDPSLVRYSEGSIPACAGEPTSGAPLPPVLKVYPRVCGGTGTVPNSDATSKGLSPRVRGNPRLCRYG